MKPWEQGQLGEFSAMEWLAATGALVAVPVGRSPDWDVIAEYDGRLLRVQIKSSTYQRNGRWVVTTCTRGGNRSWSGLSKRFDASRCDYLLVVVGDGRRWFIPSSSVSGGNAVLLGGPKYAEYEVEPGPPLRWLECGVPRGDSRAVKGTRL